MTNTTPPRASPSPSLLGRTLTTPTHTLLLVAPLGAGSYGGVYSALDLRTGKQYAVKHVDTSRLTPQQTAMQRQEPTLHSKCLGHTGVLPLHSALDVEDGWCLVLGHAESGDLFDAVTGGSLWRDCRSQVEMEARSRVIFAQVCEAVAHCHSSGVYHRDLKPENILLTWTPPDEEEEGDARKKEGNEGKDGPHSPSSSYHSIPGKHPRIWLSDFGLATECPLAAERGCGSAYYMAPESNLSTLPPRYPYISSAADVWSLGVLLANLASRRNPWQRAVASDPMYSRFLRHRSAALARSLHVSKALASILARVFSEDPRKRPSILELRDLVLNVPCFSEELELEEEVSVEEEFEEERITSARVAGGVQEKGSKAKVVGRGKGGSGNLNPTQATITPSPASTASATTVASKKAVPPTSTNSAFTTVLPSPPRPALINELRDEEYRGKVTPKLEDLLPRFDTPTQTDSGDFRTILPSDTSSTSTLEEKGQEGEENHLACPSSTPVITSITAKVLDFPELAFTAGSCEEGRCLDDDDDDNEHDHEEEQEQTTTARTSRTLTMDDDSGVHVSKESAAYIPSSSPQSLYSNIQAPPTPQTPGFPSGNVSSDQMGRISPDEEEETSSDGEGRSLLWKSTYSPQCQQGTNLGVHGDKASRTKVYGDHLGFALTPPDHPRQLGDRVKGAVYTEA